MPCTVGKGDGHDFGDHQDWLGCDEQTSTNTVRAERVLDAHTILALGHGEGDIWNAERWIGRARDGHSIRHPLVSSHWKGADHHREPRRLSYINLHVCR